MEEHTPAPNGGRCDLGSQNKDGARVQVCVGLEESAGLLMRCHPPTSWSCQEERIAASEEGRYELGLWGPGVRARARLRSGQRDCVTRCHPHRPGQAMEERTAALKKGAVRTRPYAVRGYMHVPGSGSGHVNA